MANTNTLQLNFNQLQTPKMANPAQIYMAVGQELNKRYYQNREAYINNIANPLSKIQSRKEDAELLNNIKSNITEGAKEFSETNDWSQATNYVFEASEKLLTNEGLKGIMSSYAAEQQYLKDLKESKWDATQQAAFMLRSKHQSSAIDYDYDNNVVRGGGFNGVSFGEPLDVSKIDEKITSAISKVKAGGYDITKIITDPNNPLIQELGSITGETGEQVVSHFIKYKEANEGVDYQKIANYVYSALANNPEYTNYLKTINTNNDFLLRYDEKSNSLRNYTPQDMINKGMFKGNTIASVLAGYNLNVANIGKVNKDGSITLKSNMSDETSELLNSIERETGFDVLQFIQNPNKIDPRQAQAYQEFINGGLVRNIESSINDLKQRYAKQGINVSEESLYKSLSDDLFVRSNIEEKATSMGNLYSYNKITRASDLIDNKAYALLYKQKLDNAKNNVPGSVVPNIQPFQAIPINTGDITSDINKIASINTNIPQQLKEQTNIENSLTTEDANLLGLSNIDKKSLLALDVDSLPDTVPDYLKGKIESYQQIERGINLERGIQANASRFMDKIYKEFQTNKDDYTGLGYYRIADTDVIAVLDNDLRTFEEVQAYNEALEDRYRKAIENAPNQHTKNGLIRLWRENRIDIDDEEEFKKVIANAADNISHRYNRKAGINDKLTLSGNMYDVVTPTPQIDMEVNTVFQALKHGNGNFTIISTPTGNLVGEPVKNISGLLTFDARSISETTGAKGTTTTVKNTPLKGLENSEQVRKLFGKNVNIIYNTLHKIISPNTVSENGESMSYYKVDHYGIGDKYLGSTVIAQPSTMSKESQTVQDIYNYTRRYLPSFDTYNLDDIQGQSLGATINQANQFIYTFDNNGIDTLNSARNIYDLKLQANTLDYGESLTTYMIPKSMSNNAPLENMIRPIQITKVMTPDNQPGFTIRIISDNNNSNGDIFKFSGLNPIQAQYMNGVIPVTNLEDAFNDLTRYILEAGYVRSSN